MAGAWQQKLPTYPRRSWALPFLTQVRRAPGVWDLLVLLELGRESCDSDPDRRLNRGSALAEANRAPLPG